MPYPVSSVTRPADLLGQANGALNTSLLVKPGFPGRPGGRVHHRVVDAWKALAAECAGQFGETLTITSSADGYRDIGTQTSTFLQRYTRTYLPGRPYKIWNGEFWYQRPGTAMAAVPGTSNHGWGLALDVCLWRNNTTVGILANMPQFNWLLTNAHRWGFSWEAQSEPWHLRYFVGDKTPPALIPPPPPEPEFPDWPPFNPANREYGLYPFDPGKATIGVYTDNDLVRYAKGVMRNELQRFLTWFGNVPGYEYLSGPVDFYNSANGTYNRVERRALMNWAAGICGGLNPDDSMFEGGLFDAVLCSEAAFSDCNIDGVQLPHYNADGTIDPLFWQLLDSVADTTWG